MTDLGCLLSPLLCTKTSLCFCVIGFPSFECRRVHPAPAFSYKSDTQSIPKLPYVYSCDVVFLSFRLQLKTSLYIVPSLICNA